MNVRIVKRPAGEAPENIRDAWIGLLLPVDPHYPHLITCQVGGVLSIQKPFLADQSEEVDSPSVRGYLVDALAAINLLEESSPSAAAWWRVNTPFLLQPGQVLHFDEECCEAEQPYIVH
jgi:hypothetical protein